uniref:Uncharacterized protein n=1 Tax=Rhizophora mucronata TaxID=61149 RepID=A0A2P2QI52_RHIMU
MQNAVESIAKSQVRINFLFIPAALAIPI